MGRWSACECFYICSWAVHTIQVWSSLCKRAHRSNDHLIITINEYYIWFHITLQTQNAIIIFVYYLPWEFFSLVVCCMVFAVFLSVILCIAIWAMMSTDVVVFSNFHWNRNFSIRITIFIFSCAWSYDHWAMMGFVRLKIAFIHITIFQLIEMCQWLIIKINIDHVMVQFWTSFWSVTNDRISFYWIELLVTFRAHGIILSQEFGMHSINLIKNVTGSVKFLFIWRFSIECLFSLLPFVFHCANTVRVDEEKKTKSLFTPNKWNGNQWRKMKSHLSFPFLCQHST